MFQTGKMQQVGNSNDIGIWLLLRQGNEPIIGFIRIKAIFYGMGYESKSNNKIENSKSFARLNCDNEGVGSFTTWFNRTLPVSPGCLLTQ